MPQNSVRSVESDLLCWNDSVETIKFGLRLGACNYCIRKLSAFDKYYRQLDGTLRQVLLLQLDSTEQTFLV